jgi:hypothetical protein
MSFKWIHYLFLAEKMRDNLAAQTSAEAIQAAIRCSISRAYYAAHWHTRNYLETRFTNFTPGRHDVHLTVVNKMINDHSELSSIGKQLDGLRRTRVRADYESAFAFNKSDCDSALRCATNIIDRINKLP